MLNAEFKVEAQRLEILGWCMLKTFLPLKGVISQLCAFSIDVITQLYLACIIFIQLGKSAIITTLSMTETFQLASQDNSFGSHKPRKMHSGLRSQHLLSH